MKTHPSITTNESKTDKLPAIANKYGVPCIGVNALCADPDFQIAQYGFFGFQSPPIVGFLSPVKSLS